MKKTSTHTSNNYMAIAFVWFGLIILAWLLIGRGTAKAYDLTPDPGRGVGIPVGNYDYLNNYIHATPCTSNNKQAQSPAFTQWIGLEGSPAKTSIIVQAGTAYVDLRYWTAGVNCYNTRGLTGNYKIVGASSSPAGTISNIAGNINTLDWRVDFNQPGKYKDDSTPFRFTPTGGFTQSRTYTISIEVKAFNVWNGTGIACIAPNTLGVGITSENLCPTETLTFNVAVIVDRQPKLTIVPDCDNQRFTVTSSDQDGGPYKVSYGIDSNPNIIFPYNFSATPLTVAIPMADKNQHTIKAFTAGKDPLGGAGWWTLKTAVYGPCLPQPTVSCSVQSPLLIEPGATGSIVVKLQASNFSSDTINGTLSVSVKQGAANNLLTSQFSYSPKPFGSSAKSVAYSSPITVQSLGNFTPITVNVTLAPYLTNTPCGSIALKNKPYLSFYGGNVCSRGAINTFNRGGPTDFAGSGSQLATFASGLISGYATAKMRTSDPTPLKGLAFANESTFFGQLTNPACNDVNTEYPMQTSLNTWLGFPSLASGVYRNNSATTLNGGQMPNGVRATLYVNGNLTINGNITYSNSYTNLSQIPSFTVIVNGNIYIDNDVTELNGTFVARGENATEGKIYTCTNVSALWGNIGPNCTSQLKVYGAFYAKDIKWLRVANSLKDASQSETYGNSQAAEVMVDGPWRYLTDSTQGDYFDAYTSLSPIL